MEALRSEDADGRRPDFLVIGAMKAGTTTLFRWLDTHPGCRLPAAKEPHFFSRDEHYRRGAESYLRLFADVPSDLVTGEASASYADPRIAPLVAERICALVPEVRLIYLVRDPVARLRSHYLHEWQRSRERRPFTEAVCSPGNPYVALSRYADAVEAFRDRFGKERLLVVRTEELATPTGGGWRRITDHLGLDPVPGSAERANVTATKMAFSPWLLRLWEAGALDAAARLPGPVRRLGRRLVGDATENLHRQAGLVAQAEVPEEVLNVLTRQWERLQLDLESW